MTLSVTQTCCLNLSLSKGDALTWSESHASLWVASISSLEEHTHCHSVRIERGCIIISWTSIYLFEGTRQVGNFDVPLFNMHLSETYEALWFVGAVPSFKIRTTRRVETARPNYNGPQAWSPLDVSCARGRLSWSHFLQSLTDSAGKNSADNDGVQIPLIEILLQTCDLMEL